MLRSGQLDGMYVQRQLVQQTDASVVCQRRHGIFTWPRGFNGGALTISWGHHASCPGQQSRASSRWSFTGLLLICETHWSSAHLSWLLITSNVSRENFRYTWISTMLKRYQKCRKFLKCRHLWGWSATVLAVTYTDTAFSYYDKTAAHSGQTHWSLPSETARQSTCVPNLKSLHLPIMKIQKATRQKMQKLGWFGGYGFPKVISNTTIWWSTYDFSLEFSSNCASASILYHFHVIASYL